ncbi:MAG: hypothetical protein ETSY2_34320 [Candidatus Entotheonella gemina]|uniref:Uncharacterized protein n=1 Tax=Candidatus Entotheonella gemina TaxID=1429439 RepID=W4LYI6_9BACT|nr:MAG: hypothetical protein ETSY2_34320 [Candidatus Entotheonella gemina]
MGIENLNDRFETTWVTIRCAKFGLWKIVEKVKVLPRAGRRGVSHGIT